MKAIVAKWSLYRWLGRMVKKLISGPWGKHSYTGTILEPQRDQSLLRLLSL